MAGMACLMGAFLLFTRWSATLTQGVAMRDVLLAGVGMGMVVVPMLIAVQSAVPRSDLGAATAMTQFFMSIGGAVGLSVMGAVVAQRLDAGRPMAEALHGVFLVGFAVCVAAVVSTLLVPAGRARDLARAEPTRVGGGTMAGDVPPLERLGHLASVPAAEAADLVERLALLQADPRGGPLFGGGEGGELVVKPLVPPVR